MKNPDGPYPGRQLFLGKTLKQKPILAYLITGRSPESRERKAVAVDNSIRIGPVENQPYDPLRHYSAIRYENILGVAAVSNGIQTEAIFETYKLLANTSAKPGKEYLEKILDGAGAEPDSYHTPRIAGVITFSPENKNSPVLIVGMKTFNLPAKANIVEPEPGTLWGISTYKGSLDSPAAREPDAPLTRLEFKGETSEELARWLFDISAASYKDNDIRVCSLGGMLDQNRWVFAIHNASRK